MSRPHVEPITGLKRPRIVRFLAPNPGPLTLDGTNVYVIGDDPAVVVDAGPDDPEFLGEVEAWIGRNCRAAVILLTHGHPDHAGGARSLGEMLHVPVQASNAISAEIADAAGVTATYAADQSFEVDDHRLEVLSTPGHSPDSVSLWLPGADVLLSGDTILGFGTTLIAPPQGSMSAYMTSLQRLRVLNPRLILPGHGPIISDPIARIDEIVEHRKEREGQILAILADGPASAAELVSRMYVDVAPDLLEAAALSVAAQLEKLIDEGRVAFSGRAYRLT